MLCTCKYTTQKAVRKDSLHYISITKFTIRELPLFIPYVIYDSYATNFSDICIFNLLGYSNSTRNI